MLISTHIKLSQQFYFFFGGLMIQCLSIHLLIHIVVEQDNGGSYLFIFAACYVSTLSAHEGRKQCPIINQHKMILLL